MITVLFIGFFFVFSFIGWIIDSLYSSFILHKKRSSGYFRAMPFCTIYGIGGLLLFTVFLYFETFPPVVPIVFGSLAAILLEYTGGWFCVLILKERLWDYSYRKIHLHGHVDLVHSFYWVILSTVMYYGIYPYMRYVVLRWAHHYHIILSNDIAVAVVFLFIVAVLTYWNRSYRLKRNKKKKKSSDTIHI